MAKKMPAKIGDVVFVDPTVFYANGPVTAPAVVTNVCVDVESGEPNGLIDVGVFGPTYEVRTAIPDPTLPVK